MVYAGILPVKQYDDPNAKLTRSEMVEIILKAKDLYPRFSECSETTEYQKILHYMYEEMTKNLRSEELYEIKEKNDRIFEENPNFYKEMGECFLIDNADERENCLSKYFDVELILIFPVPVIHPDTPALIQFYFLECPKYCPWDYKPHVSDYLYMTGKDGYGPGTGHYAPIKGKKDYVLYYDIWSNIHFGYVGAYAGFPDDILQNFADLKIEIITGANDDADILTTQIGINLWNKYGENVTEDNIHQAILENFDELWEISERKRQEKGSNCTISAKSNFQSITNPEYGYYPWVNTCGENITENQDFFYSQ